MRAYIHAFQGRPWNEDCAAACRGFAALGIECVLFTSNEELDQRRPDDIVVGGMLIMEHIFTQMEIKLPNYNYPEDLGEYLGRNIREIRVKDLKQEAFPIFIKPLMEKAAKGIVVTTCDDLSEYERMDPETELLCSDVIKFDSEWRCFIRYGNLLGIQFYYGDKEREPDISVVKSAIHDYNNAPAAYSLDFGVTDDGRTLLVEMNDGFSIGCYGLQDELYAKFLMTRWAELTGQEDPWK